MNRRRFLGAAAVAAAASALTGCRFSLEQGLFNECRAPGGHRGLPRAPRARGVERGRPRPGVGLPRAPLRQRPDRLGHLPESRLRPPDDAGGAGTPRDVLQRGLRRRGRGAPGPGRGRAHRAPRRGTARRRQGDAARLRLHLRPRRPAPRGPDDLRGRRCLRGARGARPARSLRMDRLGPSLPRRCRRRARCRAPGGRPRGQVASAGHGHRPRPSAVAGLLRRASPPRVAAPGPHGGGAGGGGRGDARPGQPAGASPPAGRGREGGRRALRLPRGEPGSRREPGPGAGAARAEHRPLRAAHAGVAVRRDCCMATCRP